MTTATQKLPSLLAQIRAFFGLRPGQAFQELAAEVRHLSDEDKRELAELLSQAGFPCQWPPPSKDTNSNGSHHEQQDAPTMASLEVAS